MMHVMLWSMNFMDKWRDHDCDVVREIIRVYVPLVSCPSHIAPGYSVTMFYPLSAGMTALTLWLVEGPDLKLRFAVVWVTAASADVE